MIHRLLNSLILLPDRYCYQVPADLGLCAEDVCFPNAQGTPLRGLFCWQETLTQPPGSASADTPVILFCPGTSGNLSSHLYYVELLCRSGFRVLGFDYTGFGQSAGQASLHHLVTDVLSASDFLQRARHVERFGVFGISIGANIALMAAMLRPGVVRGVAVEGVALQKEVVRGILTTGTMGPRYIDTITYEGGSPGPREAHVLNPMRLSGWLADALAWAGTTLFPFQARAPQLQTQALEDIPVCFIHGVEDPLLPFEATLQVYPSKPGVKRLWLIPGVGHAQEPVLAQDAEYAAQLRDFFYGVLAGVPPAYPAPAMTCEIIPQGVTSGAGAAGVAGAKAWTLRLHNPGPPGLALTTVIGNRTVDFRTIWVEDQAEISGIVRAAQPQASCLRLFEVAGCGATARVRQTARGNRYQAAFQSSLRALSKTLHERRLQELEALVHAMPKSRPEAPFDFFLGLYCVQIMQRTRQKLPHIARAAAEAFTRYWHYGVQDGQHGVPTPWDLAAAVLGKAVGPHQATRERDGR